MKRLLATILGCALFLAIPTGTAWAAPARGLVYVVSQGLCYETFVSAETLPNHGPFQLIEPSTVCGPGTSQTMLGPGDRGYTGGRWVRPDGSHFLCPLVGGGFAPPQ